MPKAVTILSYEQRLNRVLDAVRADLSREFSLEVLAEIACLSPFHLHRIFSAMVGQAPAAFIRRIRLLTAAQRLQFQPQAQVTHIALECGFSSSQNFARAFRAWSGVSPSEFRRYCALNTLPPKLEEEKSKYGNAAPYVLDYLANVEGRHLRIVANMQVLAKGADMNVEVKQYPARRLACVRYVGAYSGDGMTDAWSRIMAWAGKNGLMSPQMQAIGISWDEPSKGAACRYDACVPLPEDFRLDEKEAAEQGISLQRLEAGLYATYRRPVKRHEFPEAMNELFGIWLPQSGYECSGPPLELYHAVTDCEGDDNMSWDVSLCLPVKS